MSPTQTNEVTIPTGLEGGSEAPSGNGRMVGWKLAAGLAFLAVCGLVFAGWMSPDLLLSFANLSLCY